MNANALTFDRQSVREVVVFASRGKDGGVVFAEPVRTDALGNFDPNAPWLVPSEQTWAWLSDRENDYTLVLDAAATVYALAEAAREAQFYGMARGLMVAGSLRGPCFDLLVALDAMCEGFGQPAPTTSSPYDCAVALARHVQGSFPACGITRYQHHVVTTLVVRALRSLWATNVSALGWNNASSDAAVYTAGVALAEAHSIIARVDLSARAAFIDSGDVVRARPLHGRRIEMSVPCKINVDNPVFVMVDEMIGKARLSEIAMSESGSLSAVLTPMRGGSNAAGGADNKAAVAGLLRGEGHLTNVPFIPSAYASRTTLRRWGHDAGEQPVVTRSLHVPEHIAVAAGRNKS